MMSHTVCRPKHCSDAAESEQDGNRLDDIVTLLNSNQLGAPRVCGLNDNACFCPVELPPGHLLTYKPCSAPLAPAFVAC